MPTANVGNHAVSKPGQKIVERILNGVLDESTNPARLPPGSITVLQNYVYGNQGGVTKRTGSGVDVGTGVTGSGLAIRSGVRWYRGVPSVTKQMIVQSGDHLFLRNDGTGAYTQIAALAAGSSTAFFASAFDPNVPGDVLIITYGSGQPLKWDGANISPLSSAIMNPFTGCCSWHNHVFFWGDPNNPDTIFNTDVNNPESYTFSTNFGGYQIGPGDGDAFVQRCIGVGQYLYAFKANGIWAFTGFDNYAGNFQFTITPIAEGVGTSCPFSVARFKDSVGFWTGAEFKVINPDTSIGLLSVPITNQVGIAALGSQAIVRAVGGSFMVAAANGETIPYEQVYMCAVDDGTGAPKKVLVYDDVQTSETGKPAWSVFSGWTVGCWIPWQGPGDIKSLFWGDGLVDAVYKVGLNATVDGAIPYTTILQFTRDDCDSPDLDKWLDYTYLRMDSGSAVFAGTEFSGAPAAARTFTSTATTGGGMNWGQNWGSPDFWGPSNATQYQSIIAKIDPWLRGKNFQLNLVEQSATSTYEILGMAMHVIEEAYPRS